MALGDSNFDQTLKVNSSGDVIVGGPMVWSGIEGPDKRTLLTVTQAKKMRAKDGTPLPGTPIADVIVRYVLVQGERGERIGLPDACRGGVCQSRREALGGAAGSQG